MSKSGGAFVRRMCGRSSRRAMNPGRSQGRIRRNPDADVGPHWKSSPHAPSDRRKADRPPHHQVDRGSDRRLRGDGAGPPLNAKLVDVQNNEASSWLPESAESTKVLEELSGSDTQDPPNDIPTLVVYSRDGGLTAADLAAMDEQAAKIAADVEGVTDSTGDGKADVLSPNVAEKAGLPPRSSSPTTTRSPTSTSSSTSATRAGTPSPTRRTRSRRSRRSTVSPSTSPATAARRPMRPSPSRASTPT